MKISRILPIFCIAALMVACNDIKEEDRFITVDEVKPVRAVLIEEFTGQQCVNCPNGHEIITKLHQQYPEAVIPVAIHASNLAYADGELGPTLQGLKIPEGESYYNTNYPGQSLPFAVVDRNSGPLQVAQWPDAIDKALQVPAPANLEMTAKLNDGKIDIDINVLPFQSLSCSLQVWVLESGIKSFQIGPKGPMIDYEHNHVLRAVVNGINGEPLTLQDNVYSNKKYSYGVLDKWNTANLAIVAFLYDGSGVLNACEVPVATSTDETTEQS